MPRRHTRKYYIGGLLSLMLLPAIFLLSTSEQRSNAVTYAEIAVDGTEFDTHILRHPPESRYLFRDGDEQERLGSFQQFCQKIKRESDTLYSAELPQGCTYGFFVQVIDILRSNDFRSGVDGRTIKFCRRVSPSHQVKYEPVTFSDEYHIVSAALSRTADSVKSFFCLALSPEVMKLPVREQVSGSLFPFAEFSFVDYEEPVKVEPRSAAVVRSLGWWSLPVILLWLILFALSVRRSKVMRHSP